MIKCVYNKHKMYLGLYERQEGNNIIVKLKDGEAEYKKDSVIVKAVGDKV